MPSVRSVIPRVAIDIRVSLRSQTPREPQRGFMSSFAPSTAGLLPTSITFAHGRAMDDRRHLRPQVDRAERSCRRSRERGPADRERPRLRRAQGLDGGRRARVHRRRDLGRRIRQAPRIPAAPECDRAATVPRAHHVRGVPPRARVNRNRVDAQEDHRRGRVGVPTTWRTATAPSTRRLAEEAAIILRILTEIAEGRASRGSPKGSTATASLPRGATGP